jgi:SAM-dependent methyltransferase
MNDPWLTPWLPLIASKIGGAPILELGCGAGRDTEVLVHEGYRVVGIDRSERAIDGARARLPSCEFHCQDLRAPFPPSARPVGVVLASLSLHYFTWPDTLALARRIRDTLQPGGVLLCRLNSTEDHHFGASGHPAIEPDYYRVDGEAKRFFDRAAVESMFADGWTVRHLAHRVVRRYEQPKALWEAVVERAEVTHGDG